MHIYPYVSVNEMMLSVQIFYIEIKNDFDSTIFLLGNARPLVASRLERDILSRTGRAPRVGTVGNLDLLSFSNAFSVYQIDAPRAPKKVTKVTRDWGIEVSLFYLHFRVYPPPPTKDPDHQERQMLLSFHHQRIALGTPIIIFSGQTPATESAGAIIPMDCPFTSLGKNIIFIIAEH